MANNNTTANQAAQQAEGILNRAKASIAKLATAGSNGFQAFIHRIHNINSLDDNGVRNELHYAFKCAKETMQEEIEAINRVAAFSKGLNADGFAEAVQEFLEIEKEIQSIQDISKFRKVALMFWSGLKFIAGFILKSAMKAGEFIAVYGIRIIAIGLDFVIRLVKRVIKFARTTWAVIKAVRVTKEGKESQEVQTE